MGKIIGTGIENLVMEGISIYLVDGQVSQRKL